MQDVILNDIDRIEVIRGPGATLWGANAVNGVVNIITKSAQATQGSYASLRGGNEDRAVATGRFGWRTKSDVAIRTYAKYSDRDAEFHQNGDDFDAFSYDFFYGNQAADVDGNSFVNGDDFDLFTQHFDAGC